MEYVNNNAQLDTTKGRFQQQQQVYSQKLKAIILIIFFLLSLVTVSILSVGVYKQLAYSKSSSLNTDDNQKGTVINQPVKVIDEQSATVAVVEAASPSVVSVVERSVSMGFFTGPHTVEASIGTGFYVGDSMIITNKHVVSDLNAEYVVVDNKEKRYEVLKIYRDPLNDLAILTINPGDLKPLILGDSDTVKVGQTVIAIGNALGRFSNTVTKGVISGKGRGIETSAAYSSYVEEINGVLQTDAALNPGNSGGPLLDIEGQVIGINVAVGVNSENIGFSIPVNKAKELISDVKLGVDRRKPFLGVSYVMLTPDLAQASDMPEGALVREVLPNTSASEAGIRVNDVIVKIGDTELSQSTSISAALKNYRVGDSVTLVVWRDGQMLNLKVKLGAM